MCCCGTSAATEIFRPWLADFIITLTELVHITRVVLAATNRFHAFFRCIKTILYWEAKRKKSNQVSDNVFLFTVNNLFWWEYSRLRDTDRQNVLLFYQEFTVFIVSLIIFRVCGIVRLSRSGSVKTWLHRKFGCATTLAMAMTMRLHFPLA